MPVAATSRSRTLWIFLIALIAYAGAVPNGFAYDDRAVLLDSPLIQGTAPIREVFLRDWWGALPQHTVGSYRPLPVLSLWVDWQLGGGRAWPLHLGNVLLHGLVMVLLYRVLRRLVPDTTAFLAAIFCAVFAAPSEVVQGIVGRADLLESIGLLVGLWAHRRKGAGAAVLATAGLLLALGSKESAVMAVFAWTALDVFLPEGAPPWRERWGRYALYAGAGALYLALRRLGIGSIRLPATKDTLYNPLKVASTVERVFGAGRIFAERYVFGMIDPGRRLYDCSAQECTASTPADPIAWLGVLLFALALVSPLLLWRRSRVAAAGLAWWVIFFAPVSNFFFPATLTYGERLLYVPGFGLALALAVGVIGLAKRADNPQLVYACFGVLLIANAAFLQLRNREWASNETLAASALPYGSRSTVVLQNNATSAIDRKDYAVAEHFARRATRLVPEDAYAHKMLAVALHYQGQQAEAEVEFRRALALDRRDDLVADFAGFLARQRRYSDALDEVTRQLKRSPDNAQLRQLKARLERAIAAASQQ